MKTVLIALSSAVLLGLADLANGRRLDATDFFAIAIAALLVAWTLTQYQLTSRESAAARDRRIAASPDISRTPKLPAIRRTA